MEENSIYLMLKKELEHMEKRISQNLSGGFWILLVFNICAGISSFHINWFTIFSTLLIIWLNYMLTHSMKKMLILDGILVILSQAALWHYYECWLKAQEHIDVGASIMQLFIIVILLLDLITVQLMMTWSFIRQKKKRKAWVMVYLILVAEPVLLFILFIFLAYIT